jgi:hypothetical protein
MHIGSPVSSVRCPGADRADESPCDVVSASGQFRFDLCKQLCRQPTESGDKEGHIFASVHESVKHMYRNVLLLIRV